MKARSLVLVVMVTTTGCADEDASIFVEMEDRSVERRIDGDSPFWSTAPILFEGPFTCPLPSSAFEQTLPTAHESFAIHNVGAATSLAIRLEGSSFDASLSAEPLLMVYAGGSVPESAAAAASCLGIAKPGGGEPGVVTVPVTAGDVITAIAMDYEIGPGFDGSGSGTFRLRVVPSE